MSIPVEHEHRFVCGVDDILECLDLLVMELRPASIVIVDCAAAHLQELPHHGGRAGGRDCFLVQLQDPRLLHALVFPERLDRKLDRDVVVYAFREFEIVLSSH